MTEGEAETAMIATVMADRCGMRGAGRLPPVGEPIRHGTPETRTTSRGQGIRRSIAIVEATVGETTVTGRRGNGDDDTSAAAAWRSATSRCSSPHSRSRSHSASATMAPEDNAKPKICPVRLACPATDIVKNTDGTSTLLD